MTALIKAPVAGHCDPDFAAVRDVFEANFRDRGERGAAVAVYRDGVKCVDLWGGWANKEQTRPWAEDTIICMMSVGKGMAALCLWMLTDRGEFDMDRPVADYWPEFAGGGKAEITVRTLITGKAGLLFADAAPDGAGLDWEVMIRAYEIQVPEWEPGTDHGYHSFSAGYLLGELVRRIDGRRIERFFDEEVALPLGVDYGYGVRGASDKRVADVIPNPDSHTFAQTRDHSTKLGRAWRQRPASDDPYNDSAYRQGVMPSSNGHGNARSVARVYAALACGGTLDGVRLVSPATVDEMRSEAWFGVCGMTDRVFRYGHGFFLNEPKMSPMGTNLGSFGHPGAGGALGFADPENRISFGYSPSFMCAGGGIGERCAALSDAVYA